MSKEMPTATKERKSLLFDPIITGILDDFEATLTDNDKGNFRALASRDLRIDVACWRLAENPDTSHKAVNLRSLTLIRELDIDTQEMEPGDERRIDLPVFCNEFWRNVDDALKAYLIKFADEPRISFPQSEEFDADINKFVTQESIADLYGCPITRHTWRATDEELLQHVTYFISA